jgi:DNA-binding Lrp family transcriptional regulator
MDLQTLEARLLSEFQRDFPVTEEPFASIAARLGVSEADVLAGYKRLLDSGRMSRLGAVIAPGRAGVSTLAACAVPPERRDAVAAVVNSYPEVNHNYAREGAINLWFVVHAGDETHLKSVLDSITARVGLPVLDLRLEEEFRIDLGFPL